VRGREGGREGGRMRRRVVAGQSGRRETRIRKRCYLF